VKFVVRKKQLRI